MSAMHAAAPSTPLALSRPRIGGQAVLIGVIAGVTWLALMGAYVSSYVLGHPVEVLPKKYAAYEMSQVAPTSYGSIGIANADLSSDGTVVNASLSVRQHNILSTGVEAPQIEELRLVDANGKQVSRDAAVYWNGPAFTPPNTTVKIDITLQAPANAGPLWLEYKNIRGQDPIRFALNTGVSR